jgi:NRAMP (natural resistance-associated macrophage protein)-like metal ion transporter
MRALGPGVITGASDDDPSGIATYAQAGAQFRYSMLWTTLVTLPLMAAVQEICDRTALASGRSLGALAVERYPRLRAGLWLLVSLLIAANILNITADLVAVGEGMHLLGLGPTVWWAIAAGVGVTVVIAVGSFELVSRVFKVLCGALLVYVIVMITASPDWPVVVRSTIVPSIQWNKEYMLLVVAVLGTTISPYLFFWQSANRIEDLRDEPLGGDGVVPLRDRSTTAAVRKQRTSRVDVFAGMCFSNLVMFAIIVSTATTIGAHGSTTITSAPQAAQALGPVAGQFSEALFALGFIGSGMLAVPVLAGAGSVAMAGLLNKKWGFSRSIRDAPMFYGLVALGTIGGALLTLVGVDPVKLLVFSALVNGLLAPPFLVLIMRISASRTTMGDYCNGPLARVLGWAATVLMTAAALLYLGFTFA